MYIASRGSEEIFRIIFRYLTDIFWYLPVYALRYKKMNPWMCIYRPTIRHPPNEEPYLI